jgi:hypothetical protein
MEALGGERRYSSYWFSTSALDRGGWSASRPGRTFTPGERTPGTYFTGGWVGLRAGLDYRLDDQAIEVRSPAEAKDFSSSLCVETGSRAHPVSCPLGPGGPLPRGKERTGSDADHSPHLMQSSRMSRSYISSPTSMACIGTVLFM